MKHWRTILAHLPLPMLGLAASYGVYSFALLYTPRFFALAQAAAFELTYIGLATIQIPDEKKQAYARRISFAAVAVSVVYNSAAGYFHRNPAALIGLSFYEELGLAILHGAPLAIVAYLVADLLLHTASREEAPQDAPQAVEQPVKEVSTEQAPQVDSVPDVVKLKDVLGLSFTEIGKQMGKTRQAVQQQYRKAKEA